MSLGNACGILFVLMILWTLLPFAPRAALFLSNAVRAVNTESAPARAPDLAAEYFTAAEHNARLYNLPPGSLPRERRIRAGLTSVALKVRSLASARKQPELDRSAASALQLAIKGHHAESAKQLESALRSIRRRGDPGDVMLTDAWERTLKEVRHMLSDPYYSAPMRTDFF
jgi:hypothetical protein